MTIFTLTTAADTLYLYKGSNGADADQLDVAGNNVIDGGGNPVTFIDVFGNGNVFDFGAGIDTIESDHGPYQYFTNITQNTVGVVTMTSASGSATFKNAEQIKFAGGTTVKLGTIGVDNIIGTSANDTYLAGFTANDTINGGAGNDNLTGGVGKDTLTGGTGKDIFDYNVKTESGTAVTARDIIKDFAHASDKIDLSTIDANSTVAGNQKFGTITKVAKAGAFHVGAGELHFYQAAGHTYVEGDITGDHKADFSIDLVGLKALTNIDFVL
jgi:Ca2+-binding RTX toxin-like protein